MRRSDSHLESSEKRTDGMLRVSDKTLLDTSHVTSIPSPETRHDCKPDTRSGFM